MIIESSFSLDCIFCINGDSETMGPSQLVVIEIVLEERVIEVDPTYLAILGQGNK